MPAASLFPSRNSSGRATADASGALGREGVAKAGILPPEERTRVAGGLPGHVEGSALFGHGRQAQPRPLRLADVVAAQPARCSPARPEHTQQRRPIVQQPLAAEHAQGDGSAQGHRGAQEQRRLGVLRHTPAHEAGRLVAARHGEVTAVRRQTSDCRPRIHLAIRAANALQGLAGGGDEGVAL
eukprot:scaffold26968_cov132-Isochrysis_galbana.AAC.2